MEGKYLTSPPSFALLESVNPPTGVEEEVVVMEKRL
jgi:hypothetical protein